MTLLPATALVENRQVRLGQFETSLRQLNVADFRYEDPFGQPYSSLKRWLHFKQFQYFGAMSSRFVFGCALVNVRYAATAFVYVYDFKTGELFSRSLKSPFGAGMQLADNPVSGHSEFRQGKVHLQMGYQETPRCKTLNVDLGNDLRIEAEMPESGFEPMSICTRAAYQGWVYANKTAALRLRGRLHFRGETFDLEALEACGHHDFSCGFMRRETYWNWACFSGLAEGRCLGLNISCGVNETSFTENCLWIDGRLVKVNLARFGFDRHNVLKPWQIRSDDGCVELAFVPAGLHQERLRLGLLASNFKQVFGHFEGILRTPEGDIRVQNLPGFVEDQYAKW